MLYAMPYEGLVEALGSRGLQLPRSQDSKTSSDPTLALLSCYFCTSTIDVMRRLV
jgi:hypothetical protein